MRLIVQNKSTRCHYNLGHTLISHSPCNLEPSEINLDFKRIIIGLSDGPLKGADKVTALCETKNLAFFNQEASKRFKF
jgi:hypothetical protein